MAETLKSMFSNLYDTETIQNQNANTRAMNVAALSPGRATVYGAGVAGNMLSGGLNKMLGRPTAQEQKNSIINDIMTRNANLDPADPASQLALKKEFLKYNLPDMAMAFDKRYRDMMTASTPVKSNAYKEYSEMTSNPTPEGFAIWFQKNKITTGKSSYKEVKSTDEDGNSILATYVTGSDGLIPTGAKPAYSQLVNASDSSLDDETYEANLEPYVNEAYQKILSGTSTTNIMSEEQMKDEARKAGIRAYSKVEGASKNQMDGTAFTKNVGFFLEAKDADNNKLYSLDQAIAKATSLDHQTVSEQDQVTQNSAILDDSKAMALTEKQAVENERLNNQMLSLLNQIETGKWENVSFKAKQWLGDWDGDLASQEMFFSLATAKVMEYTNMTKGAISDAEMTLFQQAAMSLGKTTEGNRMLLEFAQAGAKATQRMTAHMRAWQLEQKANKRTDVSYAEYETEKARYRNSDENSAYFKAIIDDDWANAVDIGNSLETVGNLEEASKDENTSLGAYCANPANKGSSTYNNFCS
jgi:hypothetical protein